MTVIAQIAPLASVVRPLIGFGLLATFLMVFKPLLTGLLRAGIMLLTPKMDGIFSERDRLTAFLQLNRMAADLDGKQPNLAAELRQLAGRN